MKYNKYDIIICIYNTIFIVIYIIATVISIIQVYFQYVYNMEIIKETQTEIIYKMDDGFTCSAPKNMSKRDVAIRYYICKFLNYNRPNSWLNNKKDNYVIK